MDMESLDSCNICMNAYDNGVRPRCLPCGHNFCGSCLTNSIKDGKLLCPFCQRPHRASNASDFPIDYGMESLIIELRKASLLPGKDQSESSRLCGNMVQNAFSDQTENLKKLIESSKELRCDALQYKEFLRQRLSEHKELLPKIYDLVYRNEELIRDFDIEEKKLTDMLSEGDECQEEAASTLSKHEDVESTDIITASEEVGRCYDVLEGWGTGLQQQIPNAKNIKCSEKLLRDTTAALLIANTKDDDGTSGPVDYSILLLPIMDKLKRIRGESTLTVMDLKTRSESVEKSLEIGHVFAVQNKGTTIRSAKVTLRDRMIYLHYLQDKEPPPHAHTIQHSDLLDTLNVHSIVVFMDLSWGDSVQGRVHILLYPETPLARHFRLLCTGDLGPSYALSKFLGVGAKGNENREYVYGGDYEHKSGRGGAPITIGLKPSDRVYERKFTAGCVWALHGASDGPKIAQFAIATGNDKWKVKSRVFGQVQGGLEILEAAAKLRDIRQVTIEDCGVVLAI